MKITRRNFLSGLAGGALTLPVGYLYARHVEPGWLATRRHSLRLPGHAFPRPIRLAHVSDFHASPEIPDVYLRRAVERTVAEAPDLICLTGDFVTHRIADHQGYVDILAPLAATAPTFACPGNHDGGEWVAPRGGYRNLRALRRLLGEAGITLLHNRCCTLEVSGQPLQVAGVGDLWANELYAAKAFADTDPGLPTLLLSHNPDSKRDLRDAQWDLMLCGHTHGGQLKLPLLGTPFAPVRDFGYVYGLNPWQDRWIHTTSGVGNLHGLRFNCRPEIAILTLTGRTGDGPGTQPGSGPTIAPPGEHAQGDEPGRNSPPVRAPGTRAHVPAGER